MIRLLILSTLVLLVFIGSCTNKNPVSPDTNPPDQVTDLTIADAGLYSITLTWTAPGDNNETGKAHKYDLRYYDNEINELNWDSAFTCMDLPTPKSAGQSDTFTVKNLTSDKTYYFAIKSLDENQNISKLSNVVMAKTIKLDAIENLTIVDSTATSISLSWTAPGINNGCTTIVQYDLRYYDTIIDENNWDSAYQCIGEPIPGSEGSIEKFRIDSLIPNVEYYFAITYTDAKQNHSEISNVISGKTLDIFGDPIFIPINKFIHKSTLGDINGDNLIDLAFVGTRQIWIMINLGGGSFLSPTSFNTPDFGPINMADYNNDGHNDLGFGYLHTTGNDSLKVLFNAGNGTFNDSTECPIGKSPRSMESADFDNDGDIDIVTANVVTGDITVLMNKGDGTFEDSVNYYAGLEPFYVVAEDFNNDGYADLAVGNKASYAYLAIFINNGDGTFQDVVNYGTGCSAIACADFDKDNDMDLVVNHWYHRRGGLYFFNNNGDGTFTQGDSIFAYIHFPCIVTSDFNLDGKIDIAAPNDYLRIYYSASNGHFDKVNIYETGYPCKLINVADLDNDSDYDLVVYQDYYILIFMNSLIE